MVEAGSKVILLVEDDQAHAEIVRRTLSGSSFPPQLVHVEDGRQALDYLYRRDGFATALPGSNPDLILLDLRMPRMDGLEVLKKIKDDPLLARIPVIIMSTSAAQTDMLRAYDLHVNSYLVKPIDFDKYLAMMEMITCYWFEWNRLPQSVVQRGKTAETV